MSYPICSDLDQQKHFFEGVFCRALTSVNLSTGGDYRPATAEIVSGNYFSVLGVGPALGRVLANDDDGTPNANPVAVLSYDFWETQLGGAPDVVGRKVLVNRHPLTIIGVAASTFEGIDVGEVPALWIPTSMSAQAIPGFNDLLDRRTRWMQVLGRLNQGDIARGSGRAATLVQSDATGGYAPRRLSRNHTGAPEGIPQFFAGARCGATRSFLTETAVVGTVVGAIRCDGSIVRLGLSECLRSVPGTWIGPRS
jgi:hypothetical protein